jgi:endonuclease/exonuclease/phosphatase family metal-dependent hydrolase
MKTNLIIILSFLVLLQVSANAQPIIVGSYNLRLDIESDKDNRWAKRSAVVNDLIRFHDFDILGTQEAFDHQLKDILTTLPYYDVYGKGRDDGLNAGEHAAIFYKKEKFHLLDKGDFWLSETPEKPSLGWDATCCKRICSWIYLRDKKTKKQFYVFNAHYDHQGTLARKNSSLLVLEKIKSIAKNKPVIFMGDLNGDHYSDPYLILKDSELLKDTYNLVPFPYATTNSYNNFGKNINGTSIIDHIFISKQFTVKKWGLLTDTYQGKYPSDHFPVLTELYLK